MHKLQVSETNRSCEARKQRTRVDERRAPLNSSPASRRSVRHGPSAELERQQRRSVRQGPPSELEGQQRRCVREGPSTETEGPQGTTPLYLAAEPAGTYETTQMLLDWGADIEATDFSLNTPLHRAVINNRFMKARLLIKSGADIEAQNFREQAPLHLAAEVGHGPIVQMLIQNGAEVNAIDCDDQTPLHYAAYGGNIDAISALLRAQADFNSENNHCETPYNVAEKYKHTEAMSLLDSIGGRPSGRVASPPPPGRPLPEAVNPRVLQKDSGVGPSEQMWIYQ